MLEHLLQESEPDFLSRTYDWLCRYVPIDQISGRTWIDIIGLTTGFVSGYRKNLKGGLIGYGIAVLPETWDWALRITRMPSTAFEDDMMPFLREAGADLLFIGLSYSAGRILRAYHETSKPHRL